MSQKNIARRDFAVGTLAATGGIGLAGISAAGCRESDASGDAAPLHDASPADTTTLGDAGRPTDSRPHANPAPRLTAKQRWARGPMLCHKGAQFFAGEQRMESFRAAVDLGADGSEFDIRRTKDGELLLWHDDFIFRHLDGFGSFEDYTAAQLRQMPFVLPGPMGQRAYIPTFDEVLALHKTYDALLLPDLKGPAAPEYDRRVREMIGDHGLWPNVVSFFFAGPPREAVFNHPDFIGLKTGTDDMKRIKNFHRTPDVPYADLMPEQVEAGWKDRANYALFYADDPRLFLSVTQRLHPEISTAPHNPAARQPGPAGSGRSEADLLAIIDDDAGWNDWPDRDGELKQRILKRALAVRELLHNGAASPAAAATLARRARRRSMHVDWRVHGLDSAYALRALVQLRVPAALDVAVDVLHQAATDPQLEQIKADAGWPAESPRSAVDWRINAVALNETAQLGMDAVDRIYQPLRAQTLFPGFSAAMFRGDEAQSAARATFAASAGRASGEVLRELASRWLGYSGTGDASYDRDVRLAAAAAVLNHGNETWARKALAQAGFDYLNPLFVQRPDPSI